MTEPGAAAGSGERIGAYEIQGPLGRGGMGEVFLAWDNRLKRRVAIKRIRADQGIESTLRQRLLREARAAAGLSHPAIVQVYDLIEDATGDSIVLEYVEGRTLAAILAGSGPLDPVAAVRLTCEIAGGLAAAHAAGIVHRDLKTDNVIVTPTGHAKILDFGLAQMRVRPVDDVFVTQQGVLLGTFHAMSPEQASGEEIDERSDLFALGILLYETLTGCSPFRGSSPAETLGRVLFQKPPRVDAVNPGVPGWLGELVERLLAKEPGERPESAAEVARELEAIAAYLTSSAPSQAASSGDLPTVVDVPRPTAASQPALSFRASDPPSDLSIPGHPVDGKRKRRTIAALLAMALLGGVLSLGVRPLIDRISGAPAATAPLRVLVLQPRVNGRGERLELAALGARLTSLSTLGSLEGVAAIDSAGLPGNPATPKEMAQAAAANEVLAVAVEEVGGRGRITLTRQDAKGRRLWDETVDAPFGNGDLIKLAQEVDKSLLRGYNERALRPGTPTLTARTEDYAAFLSVRQRLDAGAMLSQEDLDRLQQVINESPSFLEARLLAAHIRLTRFLSTRRSEERDQALGLIKGSLKIVPNDPRPLFTRFWIELAQDDTDAAALDLQRIETLVPDDPRALVLRANLAEHKGHLDEAIDDLKRAVATAPTWQDLNRLADLEARTGHIVDARKHLQKIRDSSPDNVFALESLAKIELLYGDLRRAEQLYRHLIRLAPRPARAYYTNLGTALWLQGRYEEAVVALDKALEIAPDHVGANVNLAEIESALGRRGEAEAHFRKALQEIEKNPVPENRLARAECLAYLGRRWEAVSIIQELRKSQDDTELLKSAALVYAVVGDQASALSNIAQALKKGLRRDWFRLPGFDSLKNDPEFIRIMSKAPGAS